MDNEAQEAGNTFAIIVGLVIPILDAAELAANALGISAKIANIFGFAGVGGEVGEAESVVLQASSKSGKPVVEIWAKGEDGYARAMTEAEARQLKKDLGNQGELLTNSTSSVLFLPFASKSTAITLYLSNTLTSPGFKKLQNCTSRPGSLRKRMDELYQACAPFLHGPGGANEELLGDFDQVVPGAAEAEPMQPLAVAEASLPMAEAALVQEAAQAQYLAPLPVRPANHADQYFYDLQSLLAEGPAVPWDLGYVSIFGGNYLVDLEAEIPSYNYTRYPGRVVLDEAGPSNVMQYESGGPLEGLPPLEPMPPLTDLPRELELAMGWFRPSEGTLDALTDLEQASFGDPQLVINRIENAFREQYRNGFPAYGGEPLIWQQTFRSPSVGSSPEELAGLFQRDRLLSDGFMQIANREDNTFPFHMISGYTEELQRLPIYEGIAYTWRTASQRLIIDTIPMRRAQTSPVQSWFRLESTYSLLKHLVLL
jgi:hypothetical protein